MTNHRFVRFGRLIPFSSALLLFACGPRVDPHVDDAGISAVGSGGTTSLGVGGSTFIGIAGGSGSSQTINEKINEKLISRWNQAAHGLSGAFTFHWSQFDQFPHPTYKGGSAEAYQAFAQVLLAFLQQGDNFDFLVTNNLIDSRLVYVFSSGQNGLDTSFRQLITDFSTGNNWANIPCATRNALQQYANKLAGGTGPSEVCTPGTHNPGTGGAGSVLIGSGGSGGFGGTTSTSSGVQCGDIVCGPGWLCCLPTIPRCAPEGYSCDL